MRVGIDALQDLLLQLQNARRCLNDGDENLVHSAYPAISIGVLAYNEEQQIGGTLQSLFTQDVFQQFTTELVIIANGCRDRTVEISERLLADFKWAWSARGSARVESIPIAGKSNAWNEFVHRFSSSDAEVLVLMDADIKFLNVNAISSMIAKLQSHPQAIVCGGRPIKDIELKPRRTLFERLLVLATPGGDPDYVPLSGGLYSVRSEQARLIRLPSQIICEDGFLRALLVTRGFTAPEDPQRIIRDMNAAHCFASVSTLSQLFRHEKWLVCGSIVNMLLFRRFSAEASPGLSAMDLMQMWEASDVNWLPRYIDVESRRQRLLPRSWWLRRWSRLRGLPLRRRLVRFPIAAIAAVLDAFIFLAAIRDVRQATAFGYWRKVQEEH